MQCLLIRQIETQGQSENASLLDYGIFDPSMSSSKHNYH